MRTNRGNSRWRSGIWLAAVALALGWSVLALASESDPTPVPPVSDAQLFTREFREGGALKFFDATEAEVRLGKFESALLRYRFLKGQVAGNPAYRPLIAMVNHRLHFLQEQMGLAGVEVAPLRPVRMRRAARKPAAQETKAAGPSSPAPKTPADAPEAKAPEAAAIPPEKTSAVSPGDAPAPAPADPKPAAPAPPAGPSPAPGTPPASPEGDKVKEPAPEPPPPPSRWQRLKKRLLFWR